MEYKDQALYILTAGRLPTWPEREHWQRTLNGSRSLCVWLMVLFTLFFAHNAVAVSLSANDGTRALMTTVLMVAAGIALIWFTVAHRHRCRTALQTQWYDEQADKKRLEAGYTVALYGDRIVRTDLRGATTFPYSRITACFETVYGFYVQAGTGGILIRGADLTPEQVAMIRELLQTKLDPAIFHIKGRAMAALTDPLPIPCFDNDDRVITRATVTLRQAWEDSSRYEVYRQTAKGLVIPAMVVYGTSLANTLSVTGLFFLDLALLCPGAVMVGMLILWCLSAFGERQVRLSLAFTRDGLAAFAEGRSYFVPWERVRLTEEKHGVNALFSDGNSLKIPWNCMEDAEQIRRQTNG